MAQRRGIPGLACLVLVPGGHRDRIRYHAGHSPWWTEHESETEEIGTSTPGPALRVRSCAWAYQTILNASTTYARGLEAIFYNAHNDFTWRLSEHTVVAAGVMCASCRPSGVVVDGGELSWNRAY
jgi:hypothetical protein